MVEVLFALMDLGWKAYRAGDQAGMAAYWASACMVEAEMGVSEC